MVSAANGAEDFYSLDDHSARFEGLELARERDHKAMEAWSEHPYVDIVDNRADFDTKVRYKIRKMWLQNARFRRLQPATRFQILFVRAKCINLR